MTEHSYTEQLDQVITGIMDDMHLWDCQDDIKQRSDLDWILLYTELSQVQKLELFRWLTRKHATSKWFRRENIWKSIPLIDPQSALSTPWLLVEGPQTLQEYLELLTKQELVSLCTKFNICHRSHSMSVKKLEKQILERVTQSQTSTLNIFLGVARKSSLEQKIIQDIQTRVGLLAKLSTQVRDAFDRFFIVYFREQVWPDDDGFLVNSILSNLKTVPVSEQDDNTASQKRNFVAYPIDKIPLTFATRSILLEYVSALKLEKNIKDILDGAQSNRYALAMELITQCKEDWKKYIQQEDVKKEAGHISGIPWLQIYTPGCVLTRIMHIGSKVMHTLAMEEKRKSKETVLFEQLAQHLQMLLKQKHYLQLKRGKWFQELAKIYHFHLRNNALAKQVCLEALDEVNEPFVLTGHRRNLLIRVKKIQKMTIKEPVTKKTTITATKAFSETGKKIRYSVGNNNELMTVEELAQDHFSNLGWKSFHSETSILTTIFAYLMWDILFLPIPGVFISPFQVKPLDLNSHYFYLARKEEIDKRIKDIQQGKFLDFIHQVDQHRQEKTMCIGMHWNDFSLEDIVEITLCLGGDALAAICLAFAKNYTAYSGGVPDLCVWNLEENKIKFVEVKSENDRVSDKQYEWMEFLTACGIQVEEFWVLCQETKKE